MTNEEISALWKRDFEEQIARAVALAPGVQVCYRNISFWGRCGTIEKVVNNHIVLVVWAGKQTATREAISSLYVWQDNQWQYPAQDVENVRTQVEKQWKWAVG